MSEESIEYRLAQNELLNAFNQLRALRGEPLLIKLPEPPFCSFCGRSKDEVGALVAGVSDAHICFDCAGEARKLLIRG
jgi:hypothetical protein